MIDLIYSKRTNELCVMLSIEYIVNEKVNENYIQFKLLEQQQKKKPFVVIYLIDKKNSICLLKLKLKLFLKHH